MHIHCIYGTKIAASYNFKPQATTSPKWFDIAWTRVNYLAMNRFQNNWDNNTYLMVHLDTWKKKKSSLKSEMGFILRFVSIERIERYFSSETAKRAGKGVGNGQQPRRGFLFFFLRRNLFEEMDSRRSPCYERWTASSSSFLLLFCHPVISLPLTAFHSLPSTARAGFLS